MPPDGVEQAPHNSETSFYHDDNDPESDVQPEQQPFYHDRTPSADELSTVSAVSEPYHLREQERGPNERVIVGQQSHGIHVLPDTRHAPENHTPRDLSTGGSAGSRQDPGHFSKQGWLPPTVRWPYLLLLFVVSLALGVVVLVLTWYSATHSGLSGTDNSSAFFFGWRFSPTLVAVLFVLLETPLLIDVRRTEAFAALSDKNMPITETLLRSSRPWWSDLFCSLKKDRNGGKRSWVLFWTALANAIGFLVVSPLSAGLLAPEEVRIAGQATFSTIANDNGFLSPIADDFTYFRSISGLVLNLTTSAWLTNDYAVLPFWPSSLEEVPLGASLSNTPQRWEGQTTIYRVELDCSQMSLVGPTNHTLAGEFLDYNLTSFVLKSEDGCNYGLAFRQPESSPPVFSPTIWSNGGGSWSNSSDFSSWEVSPSDWGFDTANSSSECGPRSILFVSAPYDYTSDFRIRGYVCSTTYVAANVMTAVSISPLSSVVTFDEKKFDEGKVVLEPEQLNITGFENSFFAPNWTAKLQAVNATLSPKIGGPLIPLAARHNFDVDSMLDASDLIDEARRVKQRFFGEGLQSAFMATSKESATQLTGEIAVTEERVVVSIGIGLTLGILLLLIAGMIACIYHGSRLQRRPLNLYQDPGSAVAVAALFASEARTRMCFEGLDRKSALSMFEALEDKTFAVRSGVLFRATPHLDIVARRRSEYFYDVLTPQNRVQMAEGGLATTEAKRFRRHHSDDEWRPRVLRRWTGTLLVLLLAALVAALATLFSRSTNPGLYQKALTYQLDISMSSRYITSLAPYSIIPTLFAVAIKLWWGSLEEVYKRLQPYVAMTKRPSSVTKDLVTCYVNSPPIWATWKALSRKHWLLAVICSGAFLTEICEFLSYSPYIASVNDVPKVTVTMSALWERNPASLAHHELLRRTFELRTVPNIFEAEGYRGGNGAQIRDKTFGDPFNSWMYGGAVQLALGGSQPSWSKDGWSFVPLDTSALSDAFKDAASSAEDLRSASSDSSEPRSNVNVTMETPALRARITCSPFAGLDNQSNWLTTWYRTDRSKWNFTEKSSPGAEKFYELRPRGILLKQEVDGDDGNPLSIKEGGEFPVNTITGFSSNQDRITCCANETDGIPGRAAIGYWSAIQGETTTATDANIYPNFTVKWLVGEPFERQWTKQEYRAKTHYLWKGPPKLTALNCLPIIESANAKVTVDVQSGAVREYLILDDPVNATEAWSDNLLLHGVGRERLVSGPESLKASLPKISTSYGALFTFSLLNAAATTGEQAMGSDYTQGSMREERIDERTFNFRARGLNMDFMSYALYSLVDRDVDALLDPTVLSKQADKVFSTFFQHYVSGNVTEDGGKAFQRVGAKIPWDIGPIVTGNSNRAEYALVKYKTQNSTFVTNTTAPAIVHTPVHQLYMSPAAVILSLVILVFLFLTAMVTYFYHYRYFKALPRDVDSIASVLAFAYDSPALLQWVAEREDMNAQPGPRSKPRVPLPWRATEGGPLVGMGRFRGSEGKERWGIELVEDTRKVSDSGKVEKGYVSVRAQEVGSSDSSFLNRPANS
ncbi:MAG: hypothetical protein M1833_006432 [Piccolia ochrophora]|nr:MAG: hypothetical protein M1833_006432 [Piccolia ochrophora]